MGRARGPGPNVPALVLSGLSWALAALVTGGAVPRDEIAITYSRGSVKPSEIRARKGDSLRLLVRSEDGEHCFAIDALRVEKRVTPGRTSTVELSLDRAGEFPYYCCLEPENAALRGRLLVSE
jgi:heme/copper-type cytochrome/quinol oxidase subunit 2